MIRTRGKASVRILFVTSLMETGGVETNLVGLARELRALGHEVLVVSSGGDLVPELERSGARHVRMRLRLRDPVGVSRAALGIDPAARVVTTIGALHPRKSHDLFLRACQGVAERDPAARFVIAGEGPERGRLRALAQELALDQRVVLTGRRRDVPAVL